MKKTTRKGLFKVLPWSVVVVLIFAFAISGWQVMPVKYVQAAALNPTSVEYLDTGVADGTIDTIRLTFTDVTACTYEADDWSVGVAGTVGVTAVTGFSNAGSCDTDEYIDVAVTVSTTFTTGGAIDPRIDYTDAATAGSVVADLNDGAANFTASDAAAPFYVSSKTLDNNGNGTVDYVKVTYSEAIQDSSVSAADFQIGVADTTAGNLTESFTSTEPSSGTETDAANDAYIYIGVASLGETISSNKTDYTLKVEQVGAVADNSTAHNSLATFSLKTSTDGAVPIMVSAATFDFSSVGTVNQLIITFSETVTITDSGAESISLVASSGTATVDTDGYTGTGTTLTLVVIVSETENTAITISPTYTAGSPTFTIKDASLNEMANNETVVGTDGAAPVILSSTPADGYAGYDRTGNIAITFSEAMTTASVQSALSYSPTFGTPAYTWTVSDTVVTINPSITLSSATSYTVTLTSAPSAASGDGHLTDTITFTSASGTGSSTSTSDTTSTVTSTTPTVTLGTVSNLTAGETTNLTWGTAGTGIDTVALYYSTDSGTTYNQIAYNLAQALGTYSWTVPAVSSSTAMVKVVAYDSGKAQLDSDTSSVFTIVASSETTTDTEETGAFDEYTTTDSEGRAVAIDSGETGASPLTGEIEAISTVITGEYIRAYGYSTVYYIDENMNRRPFWNATTFFTYADSWDEVVWVTNATLATLDLGEAMLPAPGTVLVKIQSTPETYAIEAGNVLRWIPDETTAAALYGQTWSNYVIDLEPTVFSKYTIGDDMSVADEVDTSIMKTRDELAGLAQ